MPVYSYKRFRIFYIRAFVVVIYGLFHLYFWLYRNAFLLSLCRLIFTAGHNKKQCKEQYIN